MPRKSRLVTEIPNLIGGVSQQPSALRFDNQCEEQINKYPSTVEGLADRPHTEFISALEDDGDLDLSADCFVDEIDRGQDSTRYILIVEPSVAGADGVHLFDLNGDLVDVNLGAGTAWTYLTSTNPKQDLKLLTVADTTFILNKGQSKSTPTDNLSAAWENANSDEEAVIWIKQAVLNVDYEVHLNGKWYRVSCTDAAELSSAGILDLLWNGGTAPTGYVFTNSDGNTAGLKTNSQIEETDSTLNEGVLKIAHATASTAFSDIWVSDGYGDQGIGLIYKEVPNITELPKKCFNSFNVKVITSVDIEEDDYYVTFQSATGDDFGDGSWVETLAPEVQQTIDGTYMPHKLIPDPANPGEYLFSEITWDDRLVGDDNSNPFPENWGTPTSNSDNSFYSDVEHGNINDIFFYKDRFGFITPTNIVFSEVGRYFNFFKTTTTANLDSDPIDIGLAHSNATDLISAIPFDQKLIVSNYTNQFAVGGTPLLTSATVNQEVVSAYEQNSARPVILGDFLYFAFDRGNYQGIQEYIRSGITDTYTASEITEHVPKYITGEIRVIDGTTAEDLLVVMNDNSELFLFKYFRQKENREAKLQAAWGKLTFPERTVVDFFFVESDMYLISVKDSKAILEKLSWENGQEVNDKDYNIYLDHRIAQDFGAMGIVYSSATGKTTVTATPFAIDSDFELWTENGTKFPITVLTAASFEVTGDLTSSPNDKWFLGIPYERTYTFSTPQFKIPTSEGGGKTGSKFVEDRLRKGAVQYTGTGYFEVEVTRKYRRADGESSDTPEVSKFTGTQIGVNFKADTFEPAAGFFPFRIGTTPDAVTVTIKTSNPKPCKLLTAEFEHVIREVSPRFR